MDHIKELQNKINTLELRCRNSRSESVRHQWAIIHDEYMTEERVLWSEIHEEATLNEAIARAEELLGQEVVVH